MSVTDGSLLLLLILKCLYIYFSRNSPNNHHPFYFRKFTHFIGIKLFSGDGTRIYDKWRGIMSIRGNCVVCNCGCRGRKDSVCSLLSWLPECDYVLQSPPVTQDTNHSQTRSLCFLPLQLSPTVLLSCKWNVDSVTHWPLSTVGIPSSPRLEYRAVHNTTINRYFKKEKSTIGWLGWTYR